MRRQETDRFSEIIFPFVVLIFFGSSHLSGQINVDNRSFEPVVWFDTDDHLLNRLAKNHTEAISQNFQLGDDEYVT